MDSQVKVSMAAEPSRLRSFRPPRDLTLGGILPPRTPVAKKVYQPNLKVNRVKNKEVTTSKDTRDIGKSKKRPERPKTNDRNNKNKNIIQTNGIFSEGAGKLVIKRSSFGGGRNSDADVIKRPVVQRRDIKDAKTELTNDDQALKELLGDQVDFDFSRYSTKMAPQLLELTPSTVDDTTKGGANYPADMDELFGKADPKLVLIQLPLCLPAYAPEEEPPESAEEQATIVLEDSDINDKTTFGTLEQFEEGLLGKLIRYKSGRTEMTIGGTKFDINLGLQPHATNLVSGHVNREERSGEMFNFGSIDAKLITSLNWDEFLVGESSM